MADTKAEFASSSIRHVMLLETSDNKRFVLPIANSKYDRKDKFIMEWSLIVVCLRWGGGNPQFNPLFGK